MRDRREGKRDADGDHRQRRGEERHAWPAAQEWDAAVPLVGSETSARAWDARPMLTCAACLRVAPPEARFCPRCGARLSVSLATQFAQAERRQVSVMFADIVDYTEIAARLDPEELRNLIYFYQSRVAQAVKEYGGFVSRYIGDGVVAYFGWPLAGEIDAESAVRSALAVKRAVQDHGSSPERLLPADLLKRRGRHAASTCRRQPK